MKFSEYLDLFVVLCRLVLYGVEIDLESPPHERREFRFLVTGVAIGPYL